MPVRHYHIICYTIGLIGLPYRTGNVTRAKILIGSTLHSKELLLLSMSIQRQDGAQSFTEKSLQYFKTLEHYQISKF